MSLRLALPDSILNHLSGSLEVQLAKITGPNWAKKLKDNHPLDASVTETITLSFEQTTGETPLQLKAPAGIGLDFTGSAASSLTVRAIWPGQTLTTPLDDFAEKGLLPPGQPEPGTLLLELDVGGSTLATVKGSAPVTGLLNATYGVSADGRMRFVRLLPADADEPSVELLTRLFSTLRWPLSLPSSAPAPGAVTYVETLGDIKLSLGLAAGYEWSGATSLGSSFPGAIGGRLAAIASVKLGYTIAGAFRLSSALGSKPNWLRLRVERSSGRNATFALGLDITAETSIDAVPEKPLDVLEASLGLETGSSKRWLDAIADAATPDALVEKARTALSDAASRVLSDATKHVAAELDANTGYASLQKHLSSFRKRLDGLPEEAAALLIEHLDALPSLKTKLKALADALQPEVTQRYLDEQNLGLLWKLGVKDLHQSLTDSGEVKKIQELLTKIDSLETEDLEPSISDWFSEIKARADISAALALIDTLKNPEDLAQLAKSHLLGLLESLLERGLDKLPAAQLAEAHAKLTGFARGLRTALDKVGEALALARKARATLSLAASFAKTKNQEALIDIEFDLKSTRASTLLAQALDGDFSKLHDVFASLPADPAEHDIILHACALEETRKRSAGVSVAFFDWSKKSVSTLVESFRKELVTTEEGTVCFYTHDVSRVRSIETKFPGGSELLQTQLLVRRFGRVTPQQPHQLEALDLALEVLRSRQPSTSADLARLLALASDLGLIEKPHLYIDRLRGEFGDPIAKFSATYRLSYTPDALREALLQAPSSFIAQTVITTIRRYVKAKHGGAFNFTDSDAEAYLAYDYFAGVTPTLPADKPAADLIRKKLTRTFKHVLHGHPARRSATPHQVGLKNTKLEWYEAEVEFLVIFADLRALLSPPVPATDAELHALVKRLLSVRAPHLDFYGTNVVFLILDQIIRHVLPAARLGRASLELEILDDSGLTARRFFTA